MSYGRGHRKNNRTTTRASQAWYDTTQLAHLARIEAEQAAREPEVARLGQAEAQHSTPAQAA